MKKCYKIVLCLMLVLSCVMGLCACGGNKADTPATEEPVKLSATGRYEIEAIRWDNGTESTGDQLQEQLALMGGETFLELNSDRTALLCLYGVCSDMEYSDTKIWNEDLGGMEFDFSVNDGKVTLKQSGTTFIFVKK